MAYNLLIILTIVFPTNFYKLINLISFTIGFYKFINLTIGFVTCFSKLII